MKEHKPFLPNRQECKNYTLFIDRDGVINQPIIDDYAKKPQDLKFIDGAIKAIGILQSLFKQVIMVTNQQGVGKGVMTNQDLEDVHLKLYNQIKTEGLNYFDLALYAPYLKTDNHNWRKPQNGMLLKASNSLKDIDFNKAIMVGDSPGDMALADAVNCIKVRIKNNQFSFNNQHYTFTSLIDFTKYLTKE